MKILTKLQTGLAMPWETLFDENDVLDKAGKVFWAKGYEGTSMSDLLTAMGVNKGSLYNSFGNKKNLFTKALLQYDQDQRIAMLADLSLLNNPILAVRTLFDIMIRESAADEDHKGCFLVNTALDLPNHDKNIEKIVKNGMKELEAFFVLQMEFGKLNGTIPSDLDVKTTAKGLLALCVGLRVMARGVFDEESLQAIKQQALKLIS